MDKLQAYLESELDGLRSQGIFNRPRVLETEQKATVTIDGHEVITLSSNNYLGLTVHSRLREAAIKAIEKYGVDATIGLCNESWRYFCYHAGRRYDHQR